MIEIIIPLLFLWIFIGYTLSFKYVASAQVVGTLGRLLRLVVFIAFWVFLVPIFWWVDRP